MPDVKNPCVQRDERVNRLVNFVADGGANSKDNKVKFRDESASVAISESPEPVPRSPSTPSPKRKSRAAQSSKYFGVRFRPDLRKWVAEIRVYEWKQADRKVWLGTFESEDGAAYAVDAARKLLRCRKKRLPNFPCPQLLAYDEVIPSHLDLTNIEDEAMFKEVTVFVKRKAQDYAAGFATGHREAPARALREQLGTPTEQIQVGVGNMYFRHPPGMMENGHLFSLLEDDISLHGYSPSSLESYEMHLPTCHNHCMSSPWSSYTTSKTFLGDLCHGHGTSPLWSSETTLSSGTSPEDWVVVQSNMWDDEVQIEDYCLVNPLQESWEDPMPIEMDGQTIIKIHDQVPVKMFGQLSIEDMDDQMVMEMDGQTTMETDGPSHALFEEYLATMGDDQEYDIADSLILNYEAQEQAQSIYGDIHHENWMFPGGFSTSFSSASNSFEHRAVC